MRSLFMVLVLIFALGLVFSPIALIALAEREKTKQVKKDVAKTACVVDARNCGLGYKGQKDAKPEKILAAEEKPAKEIAGKQKHAKAEKTTAVPKKISGLIARIEEERAATKEEIAAEEELMLEITGLIIEETMTRIGYEFYEYFFLFWEAPEVEVKDYNILISEKASPIWGSWVKVNIDETTVWSRVLRPRSEEIEDAVKQAIEATKQYLYNYEQYQFQTEDMVGTGI